MRPNVVDVGVAVLVAVSAFRGWRLGLLGQVFELGGGFIGLLVGIALGPRVASAVTDRPGIEGALVSLLVIFAGLSLGQMVGFVLGRRFGALARGARLAGVDSGLGAGFGAAITLVSFWLIGSLLIQGPARSVAQALRRSEVLAGVSKVMPEPPSVFAYLRQYLETSGFPQVFVGLPPVVGPPVKLPEAPLARKAIAAARDSVVRVVVPACGGTQLGSGWIAAPSTVVTNAHVVAGGEAATVQDEAGHHSGRVVVFDPRTDLAVIHAEGLAGPPLELDTSDFERGTPGATLGFPGTRAGRFVARAAAVQARHESATGYDIYGRRQVERDIYELRSPVRQGDSGGPFVLPSGRVAGVVFAASTTDSETGYALTAAEVRGEVARGSQRTAAVGTGGCTH